MATYQTLFALVVCLFLSIPFPGAAQAHSGKLTFRTSKGFDINVSGRTITVNGRKLFLLEDSAISNSKRNRVIEDGGSVFLFLEMDGRPNLDMLYAFQVSDTKVELLANAISSDLKDLDGDGYPEFGGSDLTEKHPSEDSMYYIPVDYYEIRMGRILYDSVYSRKQTIKMNGVFLVHAGDPNGNCCKVIVKPGLKKIRLVDPLIISERIDGPANIRDAVKGKPLFVLNDDIPVSTSDTVRGWCRISLIVDLTDSQYEAQRIPFGASLSVNGITVGKALADLDVYTYKEKGRGKGILPGYTAMRNIKATTLPENILARMIDQGAVENIGLARLKDFIRGFGFSKGQIGSYTVYQLDEGAVEGPSSPLRLLLVFNKDELFAVVHSRKMRLEEGSDHILNGNNFLSVIASPSQEYTGKFIREFNAWLSRAN